MPDKKIPDKILDATLSNQVYADKYSVGLNNQIQSLLKQTEDEVVAALAKNDPTAPTMTKWKAARLEKLKKDISTIVNDGYSGIASTSSLELLKFGKIQAAGIAKGLNDAIGVDLFNVTLDPKNVKSIVQNTLIDGNKIGEWWKKQSIDTQRRLSAAMAKGTQALQVGMVQGESIGDLISRIRGTALTPGVMSVSKREAAALVRTSVMQVSAATRGELYKANRDVLNGFEWLSTLDARTTPLCRALDGKQFDMDMNPVGHNISYPGLPAHWNCRSILLPVTKTWAELTGSGSKLTDDQIAKFDNIPPGMRASLGGPIPTDMNYDQWLKTLSVDKQVDILGPGRWKLWSENKLDMADMINNAGQPLTIEQLKNKLGISVSKEWEEVLANAAELKQIENIILADVDKERIAEFINECYV